MPSLTWTKISSFTSHEPSNFCPKRQIPRLLKQGLHSQDVSSFGIKRGRSYKFRRAAMASSSKPLDPKFVRLPRFIPAYLEESVKHKKWFSKLNENFTNVLFWQKWKGYHQSCPSEYKRATTFTPQHRHPMDGGKRAICQGVRQVYSDKSAET